MAKTSSFTIIDNKNLRGVLAPAKLLSKELFEDMLELILYSRSKVVSVINRDFKKAGREGLIDGEVLRKSLKM